MGGAVSAGHTNDELVDNLLEAKYIKSPVVERVFRAVDRADYYADGHRDAAYQDLAWRHGNLHLSAPCIYAEVMEALRLEPGLSFLNLGSGTGYLSTMVGLILGPGGINHGVELYPNVVDYAKEKLQQFLQSPALDEFAFCPPKFVVGNCLQLDFTAGRLYDRVYCGASCPPENQEYMQHLLKVGGILVMPVNDQLLQITRSSEDEWTSESLLPVSFASLILPPKHELDDPDIKVQLPKTDPSPLMYMCRSTIRTALRENIHREHPHILEKIKCREPAPKKNKRLHRYIIPIYGEENNHSDDDNQPNGQEDRANPPPPSFGSPLCGYSLIQHVMNVRDPNPPASEEKDDPMDESLELESIYENCVPKGPNSASGNGVTDSSPNSSSASERPDIHAAGPSDRLILSNGRRSTFVLKRLACDYESDKEDENPGASTDKSLEQKAGEDFASLLKEKINLLPIPYTLKVFLNYHQAL